MAFILIDRRVVECSTGAGIKSINNKDKLDKINWPIEKKARSRSNQKMMTAEDAISVAVRVKLVEATSNNLQDEKEIPWLITPQSITLKYWDHKAEQFVSSGPAFAFDRVFDERDCNAVIFENAAKPIIEAALTGINGRLLNQNLIYFCFFV